MLVLSLLRTYSGWYGRLKSITICLDRRVAAEMYCIGECSLMYIYVSTYSDQAEAHRQKTRAARERRAQRIATKRDALFGAAESDKKAKK
jgi:hypothetical protein